MGINFTVIKKNQILAGVVTLMLVTAGYLNYKYDPNKTYDVEVTGRIEEQLGDAILVDASEKDADSISVFQNQTSLLPSGDTSYTTLKGTGQMIEETLKEKEDYFIATRIDRTNQYAEWIENLEYVLQENNTTESQKQDAIEKIDAINATRNSIQIAENLIRLKGLKEVVILVNDNSINVVVDTENLAADEVAQIQSIITNEFSIEVGKVHIIGYSG